MLGEHMSKVMNFMKPHDKATHVEIEIESTGTDASFPVLRLTIPSI